MATSLAQQLQGIRQTAPNINFQKRKKVASLIFDPSEAADQDYDQVYAVAINGFEEMLTHNQALSKFSRTLFAAESKTLDRYVQTKEQNDALDRTIQNFITTTASQFPLRSLQKCLEWLIRRFDIHIHQAEQLLLAFMPFHASAMYSNLLSIITLPPSWTFLSAVKKANEPPSTMLFITALHKNSAALTSYLEHVKSIIYQGKSYHALVSQYADICVRVISMMRDSSMSEDTILAKFLPYVGEALKAKQYPEYQVANYMILTVLSATRNIAEEVIITIMQALARGLSKTSQKSGLVCLAQLCQTQDGFRPLPSDVFAVINRMPDVVTRLLDLAERYRADKLTTAFCLSCVQDATPTAIASIHEIIKSGRVSILTVLHSVADKVLVSADYPEFRLASATFFENLQKDERFGKVLTTFYQNTCCKIDDLELALQITLDMPAQTKSIPRIRRQSSSKAAAASLENDIAELSKLPLDQTYLSCPDVRRTINVLQVATAAKRFRDVIENPVISESFDLRLSFLIRAAISSDDAQTQVLALKELCEACRSRPAIDFQALLPVLICLLSSKTKEVRQHTLDLSNILLGNYEVKPATIWGRESFYGKTATEHLKWLLPHQVQRFLRQVIADNSNECLLDHKVIYRETGKEMTTHGTKGKERSYHGVILDFLSSHLIAAPIMKIALKILLCFDKIEHSSAAKTEAIHPILEKWTNNHLSYYNQCRLELIDPGVVQKLLFGQVVPAEHGVATTLLVSKVEQQNDTFGPDAIAQLAAMFNGLTKDTKATFVRALIEAIIDGPSQVSRQALASVNDIHVDTDLYAQMITELDISPPSSRLSTPLKKQKREVLPQVHDLTIRRFTHLLEILEKDEQKHPALLPLLFAKLGDLVLLETESSVSVSYTQQILLSCMYPMVDPGKIDPSTSRIDILTNCIRTSSSPQVHNRALLLVAALAEATPEQVLHGVMPIFTFMGANILRQDDGFSAHVIESTIQRIVPPLLRSLGDEAQDQIAGAAGILRSFADAFPHIPKHRRSKLFLVLIQTLGEHIFLAPLLAIFAEKRATTSPKTKSGESQQSYLEFILSLLRQFNVASQLRAIKSLIEIARSLSKSTIMPSGQSIFDIEGADEAHLGKLRSSIVSIVGGHFSSKKVRAEFMFYVGNDDWSEKTVYIEIVEALLKACEEFSEAQEVQGRILDALDRAITLLPTSLFKIVVINLLGANHDEAIRIKALEIVTGRATTTNATDEVARSILHDLIVPITALISETSSAALLCSAWQSISTIGRKSGKADPAKFTGIVAIVIGAAGLSHNDLIVRVSAIECLTTLVVVLGPRILPHLQKFMPIVFDGYVKQSSDEDADLVPLATISLLESLVKTIPSFMTPHTQIMVEKSVDSSFATDELTSDKRALLSTIAIHMPTRNVLQALGGAWAQCSKTGKKSLMILVSVMEETIASCHRTVVIGAAKEILALFLQALDLRRVSDSWNSKSIDQVEKKTIAVLLKLVLKLNDSTFRPLFVKLRDWALSDLLDKDAAGLLCRRTTFFNFFHQFTKTFKSIVLNYFNYVIEDILELLSVPVTADVASRRLWTGIVASLECGFASDNEDFWRSTDKFDRFAPLLIKHLQYAETYPVIPNLIPAIVELAAAASSEDHFKIINAQVLQFFRAESVPVRLAAVTLENRLTARLGDEWLPLLPRTIPFIAEALEDDDERVEKETHALAMTIESFLGESLDTYLR